MSSTTMSSESPLSTKLCKGCNTDLPSDKFYTIKYKNYKNGLSTLCKPCQNAKRCALSKENYTAKTKGFKKLDHEKKSEILDKIEEGVKYSKIARDCGINYKTLLYWKNTNQLII